ncbi:hypothetical protein BACEGG_00063 [Bacteroides eggerthii DSM 20697]|nr:hypothetical protein BACEGG_00063 [Bacteroides eggerthii DSM 20697]
MIDISWFRNGNKIKSSFVNPVVRMLKRKSIYIFGMSLLLKSV